MYYSVRLLLRTQRLVVSIQRVKLWDAYNLQVQNKCSSVLINALTCSFPQSMIARLDLNLLKPRDTVAVLQRSRAFDAFPLWRSRIVLNL